ncbi:hypothetical protein CFC21_075601, partial [Triticum aestivum]
RRGAEGGPGNLKMT